MSYYMKFIGNAVESPTSGSPVVIELKILGVLIRPKNLAETVKFFGGGMRREYVGEVSYDVEFEPFSTVDADVQNTDDYMALMAICAMPFRYLSKPVSPNMLPPRWRNTTGFASLDHFEAPLLVVPDGDFELQKNWGSALESLTATFTKAE